MAVDSTDLSNIVVKGISPAVDKRGTLCENGCFEFGELSLSTGKYKNFSDILFKAMDDDGDAVYHDNIYYAQGSYDLRTPSCAPSVEDLCLLQVDDSNGELLDTIYTNYTIYQYGRITDPTAVPVFVYSNMCGQYGYSFTILNLNTGEVSGSPACVPKRQTPQESPWSSSFSLDNSILAQASGSAETGEPQLLIYDALTGSEQVNSKLPGLAKALGSASDLLMVWAVSFSQQ